MTAEPYASAAIGRRPRVRWGLPDAALVWLGAGMLGGLAQIPVAHQSLAEVDPLYKFGVLLPAQQVPVLLGLVLVSRLKGHGSLRADFGLEVRPADTRAAWLGPALQFALLVLLTPLAWLDHDAEPQQLLQDLEDIRAVLPVILFSLGAVVMAPVVEETLYRGLLLRSLLRRFSPGAAVFLSAVVFAAVHPLGDPNTFRSVPALTALGLVLGVIAVRSNSLSRPILIHAGFNLTTTVLILSFSPDQLG